MREKKKLVYVYGLGRSGSTLIGQVLASSANAVSVGEFASFTTYNKLSKDEEESVLNMPCGCGKPTLECDENPLNRYLKKYQLFGVRKWYSNFAFFLPKEEQVSDYLRSLLDIYDGLESNVVIDTSKNPRLYLSLLRSKAFDGYDIKGVFVYRDIRKVWRSWRSEKGYLKKKHRLPLARHLIGHFFWCSVAYLSRRKDDLFVDFNQFRKNPVPTIEAFNNEFGLAIKLVGREVKVSTVNHEVAGNPSKLNGKTGIKIL